MHCARRLLTSGIRLLCRQEQRFLSASNNVVKSCLPDVEIPTISLPDYVWQQVDQWPDKVAIVSMSVISRSILLTVYILAFHSPRGRESTGGLSQKYVLYLRTQTTVWEDRIIFERENYVC
jgi:hypothetical protein